MVIKAKPQGPSDSLSLVIESLLSIRVSEAVSDLVEAPRSMDKLELRRRRAVSHNIKRLLNTRSALFRSLRVNGGRD